MVRVDFLPLRSPPSQQPWYPSALGCQLEGLGAGSSDREEEDYDPGCNGAFCDWIRLVWYGCARPCDLLGFLRSDAVLVDDRKTAERLCRILRQFSIPCLKHRDIVSFLGYISRCSPRGLDSALVALEANVRFVAQQCWQRRDLRAVTKCIAEEAPLLWCIVDEENMRNIVHAAIFHDWVEVVHVICSSDGHVAFCSDALNQRDAHGDPPLLLAARLGRLDHLKHLVACKAVDASVTTAEGKTFLHVLLQQLQLKTHRKNVNFASATKLVFSALEINSTLTTHMDDSGWKLIDYAINLRNPGLIAAVMIASVKAVDLTSVDRPQYFDGALRHAVLTNDVGVLSVVYPYFREFCLKSVVLAADEHTRVTDDPARVPATHLVDVMVFALRHSKFRSLLYLISAEDGVSALHTKSSDEKLLIAEACRRCLDIPAQVFRQLLAKYSSWELPLVDSMNNVVQSNDVDKGLCLDNIFSICAMYGDVDSLRSIMSVATDRGPLRIKQWINAPNPSDNFYAIGHCKLRCSPIMAAVKGRLCDKSRPHLKLDNLQNLKYLIDMTDFKSLINYAEKVEEIGESRYRIQTPLIASVENCDNDAADLLLEAGADPFSPAMTFSFDETVVHDLSEAYARLRRVLERVESLGLTRGAFETASRAASEEALALNEIYQTCTASFGDLSLEVLSAITTNSGAFSENMWKFLGNLEFLARVLSGNRDAVMTTDRSRLLQVWSQPQRIIKEANAVLKRLCTPFIYFNSYTTSRTVEMLDSTFTEKVVSEVVTAKQLIESDAVLAAISNIMQLRDRLGVRWNRLQGKPVGLAAVVAAFMKWLDAIMQCGEIAKANRRHGHIALAGCARMQLLKDSGNFFFELHKTMSRPRFVNAFHSLCTSALHAPEGSEVYIAKKIYSKTTSRGTDLPDSKMPWTTVDELCKALFWQHSSRNAMISIVWDLFDQRIRESGEKAVQYLMAVRDDANLRGVSRELSPLLIQDSATWEHMLCTHRRIAPPIIDYLGRTRFVFGRNAFPMLVCQAIADLDVSSFTSLILRGLFPLMNSESFWSDLIDALPTHFSNINFSTIFESSPKSQSRPHSVFSEDRYSEDDSLETRIHVIKEILLLHRDTARSLKATQVTNQTIEIDGSLFILEARPSHFDGVNDDDLFFHRAALGGPRLVSLRSAESMGSSALSGMVIQVAEESISKKATSDRTAGKPSALDISAVKMVQLIDGTWYDANAEGLLKFGARGKCIRIVGKVEFENDYTVDKSIQMERNESTHSVGPSAWVGIFDRYLCMPSSSYMSTDEILLESRIPFIKRLLENGTVQSIEEVDFVLRDRFSTSLHEIEFSIDVGTKKLNGLEFALQFGSDEAFQYLIRSVNRDCSQAEGHHEPSNTDLFHREPTVNDNFTTKMRIALFQGQLEVETLRRLKSAQHRYDALMHMCTDLASASGMGQDTAVPSHEVLMRLKKLSRQMDSILESCHQSIKSVIAELARISCSEQVFSRGERSIVVLGAALVLRFFHIQGVVDDFTFVVLVEDVRSDACFFLDSTIASISRDAIIRTLMESMLEAVEASSFARGETTLWGSTISVLSSCIDPLWAAAIDSILELFFDNAYITGAKEFLFQLCKIGLLDSDAKYRQIAKDTPTEFRFDRMDNSESQDFASIYENRQYSRRVEDDEEIGFRYLFSDKDPWYLMARDIIAESWNATREFERFRQIHQRVQGNVDLLRMRDDFDNKFLYSRRLDLFGLPFSESYYANIFQSSSVSKFSDALLPLHALPLIHLSVQSVAKVLIGSSGVSCRRAECDDQCHPLLHNILTCVSQSDIAVVVGANEFSMSSMHPVELYCRLHDIGRKQLPARDSDILTSIRNIMWQLQQGWDLHSEMVCGRSETVNKKWRVLLSLTASSPMDVLSIVELRRTAFSICTALNGVLRFAEKEPLTDIRGFEHLNMPKHSIRRKSISRMLSVENKYTEFSSESKIEAVDREVIGELIVRKLNLLVSTCASNSLCKVKAVIGSLFNSRCMELWSKLFMGSEDEKSLLSDEMHTHPVMRQAAGLLARAWAYAASNGNIPIMELLRENKLIPSIFLKDFSRDYRNLSLSEFCSRLVKIRYDPWNYTVLHAALDHTNLCDEKSNACKTHSSQIGKNLNSKLKRDGFRWILDSIKNPGSWELMSCFYLYSPKEMLTEVDKSQRFTVIDRAAQLGYWDEVMFLLGWGGDQGLVTYLMRFRVMRPLDSIHMSQAAALISTEYDTGLANTTPESRETFCGLIHSSVVDKHRDILGILSSFMARSEASFMDQPWWRLRVLAAIYEIAVSYREVENVAGLVPSNINHKNRGWIPLECQTPPSSYIIKRASVLLEAVCSRRESLAMEVFTFIARAIETFQEARIAYSKGNKLRINLSVDLTSRFEGGGVLQSVSLVGMRNLLRILLGGSILSAVFSVKKTDDLSLLHFGSHSAQSGFSATPLQAAALSSAKGAVHTIRTIITHMIRTEYDSTFSLRSLQVQIVPANIDLSFIREIRQSLAIAVSCGHDRTAAYLLRILKPFSARIISSQTETASLLCEGLAIEWKSLNWTRLVDHCASHGLHRTLAVILYQVYDKADQKGLLKQMGLFDLFEAIMSESHMRQIYECACANGHMKCGLQIIRYCNANNITAPAIWNRQMSTRTFLEISRELLYRKPKVGDNKKARPPSSSIAREAKQGSVDNTSLHEATPATPPRRRLDVPQMSGARPGVVKILHSRNKTVSFRSFGKSILDKSPAHRSNQNAER